MQPLNWVNSKRQISLFLLSLLLRSNVVNCPLKEKKVEIKRNLNIKMTTGILTTVFSPRNGHTLSFYYLILFSNLNNYSSQRLRFTLTQSIRGCCCCSDVVPCGLNSQKRQIKGTIFLSSILRYYNNKVDLVKNWLKHWIIIGKKKFSNS